MKQSPLPTALQNATATTQEIYESIRALPVVSPHGHCDASWFASDAAFADPAELLIIPDHYVFRMLYSQGVPLESLGIGVPAGKRDPRKIFSIFAQHWDCFLGTPSRQWLQTTFSNVFGLQKPLTPETADYYYDSIQSALETPAFRPRALFQQFNISVLATTDAALANLADHRTIAESDWHGSIIPTFRPDDVLYPLGSGFSERIQQLGELTRCDIGNYQGYLEALRQRRSFFRDLGATATDHDVPQLQTNWLDRNTIEKLYQTVLTATPSDHECQLFFGHMLIEMALMSADDGMVMQIHAGSRRNTNHKLFQDYGPNMGADIPQPTPWLTGMESLLNVTGNNPDLSLLLFTLDESCYTRELAPMAGIWPAVKLGPPWWFHDSANGIQRYLDQVVETAGYKNLAGFNDDTRAFLSIPARHDVWRQGVSLHLDTQIKRGQLDLEQSLRVARWLAHDAAISAYKLDSN